MVTANVPAMVAVAAARARRSILVHFRKAGAADPSGAIPFSPHRRLEDRYFQSLRRFGAIGMRPGS